MNNEENVQMRTMITKELIERVGFYSTYIIIKFIDSFPIRAYYQFWILPQHDLLRKELNIGSLEYYHFINILTERGYLFKMYDRKIKKMLYRVNYDLLESLSSDVTISI